MATVESDCAAVLLQLFEAVQTNDEDSSSSKSSSPSLQRFDSPEIGENSELSSTTKPQNNYGSFTCCALGCFNNSKRNRELAFYAFPNGKNAESSGYTSTYARVPRLHLAIDCAQCIYHAVARLT